MDEKLLAIADRLERDSQNLYRHGDYESQVMSGILDAIVDAIREVVEET